MWLVSLLSISRKERNGKQSWATYAYKQIPRAIRLVVGLIILKALRTGRMKHEHGTKTALGVARYAPLPSSSNLEVDHVLGGSTNYK